MSAGITESEIGFVCGGGVKALREPSSLSVGESVFFDEPSEFYSFRREALKLGMGFTLLQHYGPCTIQLTRTS